MYGGSILKKLILPIALTASLLLPSVAFGAGTYKVVGGDTLWKVAVKNQVGITELISANPQVQNIKYDLSRSIIKHSKQSLSIY